MVLARKKVHSLENKRSTTSSELKGHKNYTTNQKIIAKTGLVTDLHTVDNILHYYIHCSNYRTSRHRLKVINEKWNTKPSTVCRHVLI